MRQKRGRTSRGVTSRPRPHFGSGELDFEPDLVRRDLYDLEIEGVTDPALNTLFRAKRDEIARQITALEDRDTARFLYGSLQLYGGVTPPLVSAAKELLEIIPQRAPSGSSVTAGVFADAARAEIDRYRAVYPDFPSHVDVRDDVSELMVSIRPAAHPRDGCHSRGPCRAPAAPRGRHPRRDLPERRQATPEAADDRTAGLRRDPGRSRRARGVPDRRPGPAASPRARRQGGRDRRAARRRRLPGDLRGACGASTGFRRGRLGRSRSGSWWGAAR